MPVPTAFAWQQHHSSPVPGPLLRCHMSLCTAASCMLLPGIPALPPAPAPPAAPSPLIIAWIANIPLSLNLEPFEAITLFPTVIATVFLLLNGKSYWLSGVILLVSYVIMAMGFYAHSNLHTAEAAV